LEPPQLREVHFAGVICYIHSFLSRLFRVFPLFIAIKTISMDATPAKAGSRPKSGNGVPYINVLSQHPGLAYAEIHKLPRRFAPRNDGNRYLVMSLRA
jgi:hypothetical protein